MVINNLNIDRAGRAAGPLKTDPPLIVDADAVLALPIALEGFQPVASHIAVQLDNLVDAEDRAQSPHMGGVAAIQKVYPDTAVDNDHLAPRPVRLRARLPRQR